MRRTLPLLGAIALVLSLTPTFAAADTSPAAIQEALADRLRAAAPTERLTVFVHAEDHDTAATAARAAGLSLLPGFEPIGVAVGTGTPAQIGAVAHQPGVTYLEVDQPITFLSDTSHEATRGEAVFRQLGYDGTGTSIAINDSGVDGNHRAFRLPDGSSKVVRNVKSVCPFLAPGTADPSNVLVNCFVDVPGNDSDTISAGGHGTHVAGIAAGVEDTTEDGTVVHGAAPGAQVVAISVGASLSVYGGAQGLLWTLANHADPCATSQLPSTPSGCWPIEVVNNSWGPVGGGEYDPNSVTAKLQDALVAAGVAVVWAAGNDGTGPDRNVVNPPAQSPTPGVFGVANYNDGGTGTRDGSLNATSSTGQQGRPETYPDLSAPGTDILQACTYALTICRTSFDLRYADYAEISGTSMAAPHVAGIIAQLLQAAPGTSPGTMEDVLEDTAYEFTSGGPYESDPRNADGMTSYDKGHGLVDVAAALEALTGQTVDGGSSGTSCTTDAAFTDPTGDATAVIVDGVAPASEPALDVVRSWLTDAPAASGTGRDVTFHIEVEELPESPVGTQGQGEYFDYNFTTADGGFYLGIGRSASEAPYAVLGRLATTRETLATGLPVTYDPANDTITATLPAAAIAEAVGGSVTTDGSEIAGLEIVSRRDLLFLVPNADTSTGSCTFTAGTTADGGGTGGETGGETNTAPTASGEYAPERPRAGEAITFRSTSQDPDGDALTVTWDLGDGTTAVGDEVTHAYADAGRYTVTLTVDDGRGGTDATTFSLTVRGGGAEGSRGGDGGATLVAGATTGTPSSRTAGLAGVAVGGLLLVVRRLVALLR